MSSESLGALIASFERCIQLNQELLQLLANGETLEALDKRFAQRGEVLEKLYSLAGALDAASGSSSAAAKALELQAQAARLETQLAEALGKRRKQDTVSAVTKAYSDKKLSKRLPGQLDVET